MILQMRICCELTCAITLTGYVVAVSIEQFPFTGVCCSITRWHDRRSSSCNGKLKEGKKRQSGACCDTWVILDMKFTYI